MREGRPLTDLSMSETTIFKYPVGFGSLGKS